MPFALRHAVRLTGQSMSFLCGELKIKPTKLHGEKGITGKSWAMALLRYALPEELDETLHAMSIIITGNKPANLNVRRGQREQHTRQKPKRGVEEDGCLDGLPPSDSRPT